MPSNFNIFLFLCVCSIVSMSLVQSINSSQKFESRINQKKLDYIRDYLKKINKSAVKTIESPDGDLIDCVLFDNQPAFDHPLLQGHELTRVLPEIPKGSLSDNNDTLKEVFQVWRMSGESCPENTIPIKRTTEEDVLRASSVKTFGRKPWRLTDKRKNSIDGVSQHAIVYKSFDKVFGAEAYINVWHSKVENPREISIAQIWVRAGTGDHGGLDSIEVGSKVEYGDKYPRLFVYWTADAYRSTGCYNLDCGGFVHHGRSQVALGGAILPFSTYGGKQFEIRCTVWKAPMDGNWWLAVQGKPVGYWPSSLFSLLGKHADTLEFGGEIVDTRKRGQHTSTQMGNGHFPNQKLGGEAALMRNLQMVDSTNRRFSVKHVDTYNDNWKCYCAQPIYRNDWGTCIYYGGPGRDAAECT